MTLIRHFGREIIHFGRNPPFSHNKFGPHVWFLFINYVVIAYTDIPGIVLVVVKFFTNSVFFFTNSVGTTCKQLVDHY